MKNFDGQIERLKENIDASKSSISSLRSGTADMGLDGQETQAWIDKHKEIVEKSEYLIARYKDLQGDS